MKYYDPSGYSKVDANDNKKALQSLVDEINERGGATAEERTILNGWADEYGVPKDSMGLESQKQLPGPTSSSGVEPRAHVPSSEGGSKANLSNKLDYLFGKATGNKHNVERSKAMQTELSRIGIQDNPSGREYLSQHLNDALNDSTNISNVETRTYIAKELPGNPVVEYTATTRESFLMGPGGGIKVESVWDGDRF